MRGSNGIRLTGGSASGVPLLSLPGRDVRPALARMRKSLFEILRPRLSGARVIDLFAGTGSLGLEALSRGAAFALFLDQDPRCIDVIRKNLEKLRFTARAEARMTDAFREAPRFGAADLAFVDPPYDFYVDRSADVRRLVETLLAAVIPPDGRVLVEHRDQEGLGEVAGGKIVDERRYGDTVVTFYARA